MNDFNWCLDICDGDDGGINNEMLNVIFILILFLSLGPLLQFHENRLIMIGIAHKGEKI